MIELSFEELRQLISGNFTFFKCVECDNRGWHWYSNVTGEQVVECGEDPLDYDKEQCYTCKGFGGNLHIGDNS